MGTMHYNIRAQLKPAEALHETGCSIQPIQCTYVCKIRSAETNTPFVCTYICSFTQVFGYLRYTLCHKHTQSLAYQLAQPPGLLQTYNILKEQLSKEISLNLYFIQE